MSINVDEIEYQSHVSKTTAFGSNLKVRNIFYFIRVRFNFIFRNKKAILNYYKVARILYYVENCCRIKDRQQPLWVDCKKSRKFNFITIFHTNIINAELISLSVSLSRLNHYTNFNEDS